MLIFSTASEPGKDSQVIDFDLPAHLTAGVSPFLLNATASSDLRVVYSSSDTAVATIKGDSLFIIGPGTTCITASQAGNDSIAAAADITCILKVSAGKADDKK
ncbi:MAG TPA: hypothetical protein VHO70_08095 [Chitinispirillaceae bacterium]|nr:hypothetical protein [Chitinispirillaceae bacterium]